MPTESGFLPAYLAVGDDALKRERVAERLERRVGQLGDLAFNAESFDGESARGADIVAACNTLPLMGGIRLVTVRNADKLRKADAEELVSYLAAPAPSAILALYAPALAKGTRLYKAVAKLGPHAVIDCASPKRRDLPAHVANMAKTHGIALRADAARTLLALVGEDTVALDAELRKLSLAHEGSGPVTPEEVSRLVARTSEPKPWELVDALSERDAAKCLRLRARMPSASPYALLASCVGRIRDLAKTRALMERGQLRDLGRYVQAPPWKQRAFPGYARNYTAAELRAALRGARDAERAMKSGVDPEAAFASWLLATMAR